MPGNLKWVPQSVVDGWPPPNTHDPDRRDWLPTFAIIWQAVSTLLLAGRFYLRFRNQAGSPGLDDLLVFIGWVFSIGFTAIACIGSTWYSIDRHVWDVPENDYVGAALIAWIAQVIFIFSTTATKLSVLLFYRRMVKDSYSRTWLWILRAAIAITLAASVAVLVTYCFMCQPLSAYWLVYDYHYTKSFTCINGDALTVVTGFLTVLSDWYAVLLPLLMLRRYELDVPRRQKIALNIIFGLGFLCGGAGVVRTYYLWELNHTYDLTWTGFDLFVWCVIELQLALICACAPSCRAFFRRYLSRPLRRTFDSSAIRRHSLRWTKGSSQLASPTLWRDSRFPDDVPMGEGNDTKRLTIQSIEEIAESDDAAAAAGAGPHSPVSPVSPVSPAAVHRRSCDLMGSVQAVEGVETFAMDQLGTERRTTLRRLNTPETFDTLDFSVERTKRHDFANVI